MTFNMDDPLAGILSDGSDDSFFDDDILGKKTTQKKGSTAIDKKNALFDLTDIKESKSKISALSESKKTYDVNKMEQNLNISQTISLKDPINKELTESTVKLKPELKHGDFANSSSLNKKSKGFNDLDNSEMNIDSKKEIKQQAKSKNSGLLDDILGSSNDILNNKQTTGSKSKAIDFDSILGKTESKTRPLKKNDSQKQDLKVENTKEVGETKKSTSNSDWLGIFKDTQNDNADVEENDMPSWLVGNTAKKKRDPKESEIEPKHSVIQENKPVSKECTNEQDENKFNIDKITIIKPSQQKSELDVGATDLTMEGAALCIQQQESQLMVALQLKAQDDKLATLQMRQKESDRVKREAVIAQHEQLESMLKKQAEQRRHMQNIIAAHQERITQRIKALVDTSKIEEEDIEAGMDSSTHLPESKDTPFSKERRQLLQLVQSLQENHDREIDLLESSYRRQLAFLEVSFTHAEERMKEESNKLVKFYTEKINWLEEHHQLYKKMAEDNLKTALERHKNENESLRQQHMDNIDVLQKHHRTLMENVKSAVMQEQVLIRDSSGFSTELTELLTNVKENNAKAEQFYVNLDVLTKNTQRDVDRSLQMRETQITDMLQQLKRDRDSFENDKIESKEMAKVLESRLRQMTMMVEEDSASLRQKKMDFEFEKATFSKQTEFAKNILKKQDEDFKILKEEMNKEFQEKNDKVTEERAKAIKDSALIAKEKASIQSLKLELEKTKGELQAQLEELAEERAKMNTEKQEIHIEEQRIRSKSHDLDLLAKSAIEKQSQADKKYSEAEYMQKKYEDRIRRIQEHVVTLNAREKQIAKEKVALSRERLSLHNERKEMEGRLQCSLCRSTQYDVEQSYVLAQPPASAAVSRDYGCRTASSLIDQEMAELMKRISSRQNDVGALEGSDDRVADLSPYTFPENKPEYFKDYMDPKFMMLRLDVQKVISNLDQNKNGDAEKQDSVP